MSKKKRTSDDDKVVGTNTTVGREQNSEMRGMRAYYSVGVALRTH